MMYSNKSQNLQAQITGEIMDTIQEENFQSNLNFAISLFANGKFAKCKFPYYYIYRNLSMLAYLIKTQKSKFPIV